MMFLQSFEIVKRFFFISVYTVFFVVQVFANAGNFVTPRFLVNSYNTLSSSKNDNFKTGGSSATSQDSKKSNIRLNKRFHPESMPLIAYRVATVFPVLISLKPVKPGDHLLVSVVLTSLLRGPPRVA
ncbi:MAG: hypothetical protein ABI813_04080 [Bacteroidota bacterium]